MVVVIQKEKGSEKLLNTNLAEKLAEGVVAEVITDVEATAKTSIPLVCEGLGLNYIVVKDSGLWRIRISK